MADVDAAQRLQLAAGRVELPEDPPGPPDEQLAGLGQRHAPGGPFDQADPDFFLQATDLLRQRRLGNVLARGGSREVEFLGEGDEIAQLAEIHAFSL